MRKKRNARLMSMLMARDVREKIEWLAAHWDTSMTDVIETAVNDLYARIRKETDEEGAA